MKCILENFICSTVSISRIFSFFGGYIYINFVTDIIQFILESHVVGCSVHICNRYISHWAFEKDKTFSGKCKQINF